MKKTLLITILFVAMFTKVKAQSDTTTYWYSPNHEKYLKALIGAESYPIGRLPKKAPNGKQYTTMCDCNDNPAPNFPDAEIVCMTLNGVVVVQALDIQNGAIGISDIIAPSVMDYVLKKDTIKVPVLCENFQGYRDVTHLTLNEAGTGYNRETKREMFTEYGLSIQYVQQERTFEKKQLPKPYALDPFLGTEITWEWSQTKTRYLERHYFCYQLISIEND